MNYAIVYLGGILFFALLYWFVAGRKFYTGPLIEAEVSNEIDSNSDEGLENKQQREFNHADV